MNDLITTHGGRALSIRRANRGDVPFMDHIQRADSKALGWFPTKQFEGYVDGTNGAMALVAVDDVGVQVGYILFRDRYGGRDDVGAVYQVGVGRSARRLGVGVALVRSALASVAYGCRLMGAWCARDLEAASRFWASMGFAPVAFRTGSRGKGSKGGPRVHIYWQRRVNAWCEEPLWYPYQTRGGAVREERLVFPIMPGVDWRGELPVVLPAEARPTEAERLALEAREAREARDVPKRRPVARPPTPVVEVRRARPGDIRDGRLALFLGGRIRWVAVPSHHPRYVEAVVRPPAERVGLQVGVQEEAPRPKKRAPGPARHEVAALAYARELRDRWRERLAECGGLIEGEARHEVARLEVPSVPRLGPAREVRMLPAA